MHNFDIIIILIIIIIIIIIFIVIIIIVTMVVIFIIFTTKRSKLQWLYISQLAIQEEGKTLEVQSDPLDLQSAIPRQVISEQQKCSRSER